MDAETTLKIWHIVVGGGLICVAYFFAGYAWGHYRGREEVLDLLHELEDKAPWKPLGD